jgi:hypothetical protein
LERLWLVVERTFVENATPAFDEGRPAGAPPTVRRTFLSLPDVAGLSLEVILAAIGLVAIVWRASRAWRAGSGPGPEAAFLCWLAAYFAGTAWNLSLDWPRYYVPTALLGSLLIGVGASTLVGTFVDARSKRPALAATRRGRAVPSAG